MPESKLSLIDRLKQGSIFYRIFVKPILKKRVQVVSLTMALALMAFAQSGLLLLLGPFLKVLFGDLSQTGSKLALAHFFSPTVGQLLPVLKGIYVSKEQLKIVIPFALMFAGVLRNVSLYFYQINISALSLYVAKHYRDKLFEAILKQPYLDIMERSPAEWMSNLMNDVLFLQTKFNDIMNSFIKDSFVMLTALLTLFVIHWQTALVLVAVAPFIAFGMGRTGKKIAYFAERFQKELALIADLVLELRQRKYFIRAQKGEGREFQRFEEANKSYFEMIKKSLLVRASFAPAMEFIGFTVFALITWLIGRSSGGGVAPVDLLVFLGAVGMLLRPMRNLGEQIAKFQETKGSLKRSLGVFDQMSTEIEPKVKNRANLFTGIQLKSLEGCFNSLAADTLNQKPWTFKAENLSIMPGKSIAIVGPSGAGKSTILKLLSGLVKPSVWKCAEPWNDFVQRVSLVGQTPFLFEGALGQNLTYGNSDKSCFDASVINTALETVNIDKEVKSFEGGLNYEVRAINKNISGGQTQRLVIARALLRNSEVLLFDEATSAIDMRTESDILERMVAHSREQKTSFVAVTHRIHNLNIYDEVWFVEHARVTLKGPHASLLSNKRYREFCSV